MNIKPIYCAITQSFNFKRAPKPDLIVDEYGHTEEQDFEKTIREGKKFLGISNLALILHAPSFPVEEKDLYIGSHIGEKAVEINKLLKLHGFDSIQLEPPGLIKVNNPSPYSASVNSRNYLLADLKALATDEYANLLSINKDIKPLENRHVEKTDFILAFASHDALLKTAYERMIKKAKGGNSQALKLQKEFEDYKKDSGKWLQYDAIFDHFVKKFGNNDFFAWPEMCRNLVSHLENPKSNLHENALVYLKNIDKKHHTELEIFKFKQFITDKQEKEFAKRGDKLKYISDAIIGFSMMDYWSNQEAFLKDYRVGCPYGGAGSPAYNSSWGANQMWDIPVIDPKTLFNKDGSLGKGGILIRKKFERLLDTYQNIRVDHVMGLVDPWIYNKNYADVRRGRYSWEPPSVPEHIIYTNAHGANLSMLGKPNAYKIEDYWPQDKKDFYDKINRYIWHMPDLDPDGAYKRVLHEIILPVLEEKGVKVDDVVWENLGTPTHTFNKVYAGMPGISSLLECQAEHAQRKNWFYVGSHDTPPLSLMVTNDYFKEKNYEGGTYHDQYLIGAMNPELNNDERRNLINELQWNTTARVYAKFYELFRFGQKIQVSFMDFFGLNKVYNHAGTQHEDNWKLRLGRNYKEDFYKRLEQQPINDHDWQKIALNVPQLLKRSIIAKIYSQSGKSREEMDKDFEAQKPLIDKLEHYQNVLKEKEC